MGVKATRRCGFPQAFWIVMLLGEVTRPALCADAPPPPIRDNSFLVEEAYNQEKGVVQHISSFTRFRDDRNWTYTFTQEWPVRSLKHQLSFTLPVQNEGEKGTGATGVGDLALNYRYQAVGGGDERIAFAPRLSLLLPTGDEEEGRGAGASGLQLNLPLSFEISPRFVAHSNVGMTHVPSARNAQGDKADITGVHLGQSLIWLARPTFNAMLEVAWSREQDVTGPGETERSSDLFINPGIRGAFNLEGGLQIVPGLAFPIGVGRSRGENAVLLYLSFEHPFGRSAPAED